MFGVYVHVPFCVSRCDYCAFATWTDRFHLVDDYVSACTSAAASITRPATSVFFGGGTPSLLSPAQIGSIIDSLDLAPDAEVTVECNPETVDHPKLSGYASAGVNRLSFGVQSLAPHVLQTLGRSHDPDSVARAVDAAARAGFAGSYSVDLIMGGAGETGADWTSTLNGVLALDPPPRHVSAYGLTVEPGTPLAGDPTRHPDPDDQADKYLDASTILEEAGLHWYEISNWARPGAECRHNQLYWEQGEYIGVGCAAHSHTVDTDTGWARRWWNVRTPDRYISLIGEGQTGESAGEDLDPATRRREALELSLRTTRGVPRAALPGWSDDEVLADLVVAAPGDRLVLTVAGRLLANEVALRLVV
ncbi:MAG TPA: radical SAM family heme chaperone HemW [Acidimicrobiales bacterium]|jgi:oxygen-independent coproporphyrinogen-3 oxidase|nr:radical SAM family heme chaperone HemW [Acidimicrobiales bacterium]